MRGPPTLSELFSRLAELGLGVTGHAFSGSRLHLHAFYLEYTKDDNTVGPG
jgi:hypothetical protein